MNVQPSAIEAWWPAAAAACISLHRHAQLWPHLLPRATSEHAALPLRRSGLQQQQHAVPCIATRGYSLTRRQGLHIPVSSWDPHSSFQSSLRFYTVKPKSIRGQGIQMRTTDASPAAKGCSSPLVLCIGRTIPIRGQGVQKRASGALPIAKGCRSARQSSMADGWMLTCSTLR